MQTQRFAKKLYFYRNLFRNRLTKSRRDDKIYRQSAVAVKIESGRVPEWPMGTDCKSAAFQLRWFESTRAHQKSFNVTITLELFVLYVRETHECGRIRTASAHRTVRRAKKPQWGFFRCAARDSTRAHQKSFNVTTTLELFVLCVRETHECGRIRTAAALSQKTAQKQPGSRHPPLPTKRSSIRTGYWIFCFVETFSGPGGKKANVKTKVQSLPRPAGCVKLEEKIAHMRCILGGNRL